MLSVKKFFAHRTCKMEGKVEVFPPFLFFYTKKLQKTFAVRNVFCNFVPKFFVFVTENR